MIVPPAVGSAVMVRGEDARRWLVEAVKGGVVRITSGDETRQLIAADCLCLPSGASRLANPARTMRQTLGASVLFGDDPDIDPDVEVLIGGAA